MIGRVIRFWTLPELLGCNRRHRRREMDRLDVSRSEACPGGCQGSRRSQELQPFAAEKADATPSAASTLLAFAAPLDRISDDAAPNVAPILLAGSPVAIVSGRRDAEIDRVEPYLAHHREYLAVTKSIAAVALWHIGMHPRWRRSPEVVLTCLGELQKSGGFVKLPSAFQSRGNSLLWVNATGAAFVASLTDAVEGQPPVLSPSEALAPIKGGVRDAVALEDGSVAILTGDGRLDIQEHVSGAWATSKDRSIDRLFNDSKNGSRKEDNGGSYSLLRRGNLLLVAGRAEGDWWRAYLIDVGTRASSIIAGGTDAKFEWL